MGTNTQIENIKIPSFSKGKNYLLRWTFGNVLSQGEYSVDLGIIGELGQPVYERLNGAVVINIKDHKNPFPIFQRYLFSVKEKS